VVLQEPGKALAVIRSFATFAEARAEADRLADMPAASNNQPDETPSPPA
jgi:hypothetical protein